MVETSAEALRGARERQIATYPWGTPEVARQLLGARSLFPVPTRDYAVFVDGEPVSWVECTSEGAVAQVEALATVEAHRKRGHASRVLLRAVEDARRAGADLVFLCADASDRPQDLYRRLGFMQRDRICCEGVTVPQCYALQILRREGDMVPGELAERLGIDASSATRAIDVLVRNGYVERIRPETGDRRRVIVRPEPCPCGSPLPAVRVDGRRDDVLVYHHAGRAVGLAPLGVITAVGGVLGLEQGTQYVQTDPETLSVRIAFARGADEQAAWCEIERRLGAYLRAQGLPHVRIERSPIPPTRDPRTGKRLRFLSEWNARAPARG